MDWVDTQKAVRPDADDRATNRLRERTRHNKGLYNTRSRLEYRAAIYRGGGSASSPPRIRSSSMARGRLWRPLGAQKEWEMRRDAHWHSSTPTHTDMTLPLSLSLSSLPVAPKQDLRYRASIYLLTLAYPPKPLLQRGKERGRGARQKENERREPRRVTRRVQSHSVKRKGA